MVVGGQYEKGGGPLNSSLSLLQMLCQTQAFHFGSSETISLCNSPQHFCVSLSLPNALSG